MNSAAQILFDFLKDILYAPESARLDLDALDPEFRSLGKGMQFLADCVKENRRFARALARGDLSLMPPSGDNVIAAPIKGLQSSLRHLAWQTQQVAKGDYSQRVDFMGDFSVAFNSMIEQLKERTDGLILEKEKVEQKNRELCQNLDLVLALTNYTHNMIFVFSRDGERQIFLNQPAEWFQKASPDAASLLRQRIAQHCLVNSYSSEYWETSIAFQDDSAKVFYEIESFGITWLDEQAVVHIVMDDTKRRTRENLIYSLAYVDPLTGLNNRRYAMDRMAEFIRNGVAFLLTFVDLDYLKYCNDTFGHASGDMYLTKVAHLLQTLGGELCRVGGDEFILLQQGTDAAWQNERLDQLRSLLQKQTENPYPMSFSYATSAVPDNPPKSLEEYIKEADMEMYRYKVLNKKPLHEAVYKDDRL